MRILKRWQQWLLRFIHLQLFLTLMSLPILLMWGLPFSLLSPLGNLIFSPVLSLFLLLSSCIFFTELFSIPNQFLITLFEKITDWWLSVMVAHHSVLIGFPKPGIFILIAIPVITLLIMLHKKTYSVYVSIGCMLALFLGIVAYTKCIQVEQQTCIEIPCNHGAVTVLKKDKVHIVIDPGFIGQRSSGPTWALYTLLPTLIQKTGTTTIDHFVLLQPSFFAFQALQRLCTKVRIKHLYIPYWQEITASKLGAAFMQCKTECARQQTTIHRLGTRACTVDTESESTITPLDICIQTASCTYPAFAFSTQIDNQNITLYSAKYVKKLNSSSNDQQHNPINTLRVDDGD